MGRTTHYVLEKPDLDEEYDVDVFNNNADIVDEELAKEASDTQFGRVKLTDSSAVTDSTGLALPATEKNATIKGTLANQISKLNTDLNNHGATLLGTIDIDSSATSGNGAYDIPTNARELMLVVSIGGLNKIIYHPINFYKDSIIEEVGSNNESYNLTFRYNVRKDNSKIVLTVYEIKKSTGWSSNSISVYVYAIN